MPSDRTSDDPALWFFREIVEPTVAEFLKYPSDMRLGTLACLALDSMVNHYFHYRRAELSRVVSPEALRDALGSNWAFKQVSAVANATKHVQRGTRPGAERIGFEDVRTRRIDYSNARVGWPISGNQVMVDVQPGGPWLLSHLVKASANMWRQRLGLE